MSAPALEFDDVRIGALDFKSVAVDDGTSGTQVIDINEDEGIVTAVVSVTGVVDDVDDIIVPGAYRETLAKRNPKVCWHHAWEKPIGRVLSIEELMPGDPRLPTKTRNGKPWPREAGALIATMQMNLKSERGREAFEAIRFYSESGECEWSIGYQVPAGKSTRDSKGTRHIKMLELFELSFVLFGAHNMTGTLALKAAVLVMREAKAAGTITVTQADIDEALRQILDADGSSTEDLDDEDDEQGDVEQESLFDGETTDDEDADEQKSSDPWAEFKDTRPGDRTGNARELINWYVRGEGAAKIRWPEKGAFGRCVRIASKHMTPEQAKGFCANRHHDATGRWPGEDRDKKAYPADTHLVDTTSPDKMANEDDIKSTGVMVAVYPTPEIAQQIAVRGGEPPEELHVTLAFLGKVDDALGDGTALGDATGRIVAAAQIAAATHQPLAGKIGGIGRFPDSGDGVPVWAPVDVVGLGALREDLVTALTDAGLPVKTDHGFTPHMTLGWNLDMSLIPPVDDVPVTFDRMVVVVGEAHTDVPLGQDTDIPASGAPVAGAPLNPPLDNEAKAAAYDPALETGPDAGNRPAVQRQRKSFPHLEGTYEERQAALLRALEDALLPPSDESESGPKPYLQIDGTWPDRVVCTVLDWSHPSAMADRQSYEVTYVIHEDGSVSLGEPEKVRLTVVAVDEDGGEIEDVPVGDMLPLAEMVEVVTGAVKHIGGETEVKAGRVLSATNASRLKSAIEHLISVLAAAGIEIGDPTELSTPPVVDTETTAPSARDTKAIPIDDLNAMLAQLQTVTEES